MLRRAILTLNAKIDATSLKNTTALATKLSQLYREESKYAVTRERPNAFIFRKAYNIIATFLERAAAKSMIHGSDVSPGYLKIFTAVLAEGLLVHKPQFRCMVAVLLQKLPIAYILRTHLKLSENMAAVVASLITGTLQTYLINKSDGDYKFTLSEFVGTALSVSVINIEHFGYVKLARRFIPKVAPVVDVCTTMLMSEALSICRIGISRNIVQVLEITHYGKTPRKDNKCLPVSYNIPEALECQICHDILCDPVNAHGFLFCRSCLANWFSRSHEFMHPVIGQVISRCHITDAHVMRYLANQYTKLALEDLASKE